MVEFYLEKKGGEHSTQAEVNNQKLIHSRKLEYRKKEIEGSELLVNRPGSFIGLTIKEINRDPISHTKIQQIRR